ncbi:alkaline phosphatase D family protein [Actomonas aquatica]|uniref:Alkaline phosphatase D family protein n=1 Tax=Actomonas aquatica TaxID=2866162 RepID=A0ABZ1C573_9BACT|nr:alkaline phosphatase D family protein [Opitutus sp. WL0086]WRQ86878.1 alkaline phosphatase D family protein [Opitutus sp. WL0086]
MRRRMLPLLAFVGLCLLSATPSFAQLVARGPWSGAITPYSAEVNLVLFESRLTSLEISKVRDFTRFTSVPEQPRRPQDIPLLTRYKLYNLEPDTLYYYRVRAGNQREYERIGELRTFPLEGQPTSFRFAVAGGSEADSEAGGLAEIGYQKPLFFVQLGNLHNATPQADDPAHFTKAYLASLDSFARAELVRRVPLVYTWDRFDYGERGATSGRSAQNAFRQLTPHHPFPADSSALFGDTPLNERPVAQAFSIGRVRVLVLDTRSARESTGDPATRTMLGLWQNDWLRRELAAAQQTHALTLVLSSVPWHADAANAEDPAVESWANFPAEKAALKDWLIANAIDRVIWVSANAGALAAQSGGSTPFVLPEFQVGDIDLRPTSPTSGDWTQGPIEPDPTEEFFGLIDIADERLSITATFIGMNQHSREKLRTAVTFRVPSLP